MRLFKPPQLDKDHRMRTCLRCSKSFDSVGIGNRLCRSCTATVEDMKSGTLQDLVEVIV